MTPDVGTYQAWVVSPRCEPDDGPSSSRVTVCARYLAHEVPTEGRPTPLIGVARSVGRQRCWLPPDCSTGWTVDSVISTANTESPSTRRPRSRPRRVARPTLARGRCADLIRVSSTEVRARTFFPAELPGDKPITPEFGGNDCTTVRSRRRCPWFTSVNQPSRSKQLTNRNALHRSDRSSPSVGYVDRPPVSPKRPRQDVSDESVVRTEFG